MPSWLTRRDFHCLLIAAGASQAFIPLRGVALPSGSALFSNPSFDELAKSFLQPPQAAAPHTFWMWMNGNVTREGITLDLETMNRCGIRGVYLYSCAVGIPRGPLDYGTTEWLDMVRHAVTEAKRLGIQVTMHNSPGYSSTGGPWITPEFAMQQLVWTEVHLEGGRLLDAHLPQPHIRAGFYRDAFVLAYPSLAAESALMRDQLDSAHCNGEAIDKSLLWNGTRSNKIRLEKQADGRIGTLDLHFASPFETRAISVYRSPETPRDPFDGPRDFPPVLTLQISDDGENYHNVCTISMPALRSMNSPGVQNFSVARGKYFRLQASSPSWIIGLELHAGPRLQGWAGKSNGAPLSSSGPERELPSSECIDPASVRDISRYIDSDGRLQWNAPAGKWTVVRIGYTPTEEETAAAPDSGRGLDCDKFSKAAVDLHFTKSLQPLFEHLGPLVGTTFKALSIDSYEAGKQNWSAQYPEYFQQTRGYDLRPWLLAMTGRVIGSVTQSNQFLFDVRRTHAQMMAENYYGHFQSRCHEFGLQLHAEPYGDGTFDSMDVAEHLDVTMGEFWARYTYGSKAYIDLESGATHTLGQPIAAAEAFTGAPLTSRWTGHPYSMKAESDRMFCLGVNRLVFHTFVHQPHPTGKPGMSMGPFGTHFDRNNTWMKDDTGWISYLTRAQSILQSGEPVADICYMKGEEPSSGVPDARTGKLAVPFGYGVDIVSAKSVFHASVTEGRVSFASSVSYRCMILPPLTLFTPPLLEKIASLVEKGMILITSSLPTGSPSLEDQPQADQKVRKIVADLWGNLDGKDKRQRDYGRGQVFLTDDIQAVFREIKLYDEFSYAAKNNRGADILYTHRRIAGEDVFFISNQRRRTEQTVCTFHVMGARPEIWDVEKGLRKGAPQYSIKGNRTAVRLTLEPAESLFLVFRHEEAFQPQVVLPADAHFFPPAKSPGDEVDNFSLHVWAQPETYVLPTTSFLAMPEEGELVYGHGHCVAGLAAGQNCIRVYEQATGAPRLVLESLVPLSGWVHIALVYRHGQPFVYLNGEEVAKGTVSRFKVHPARDCTTNWGSVPRYFEGNSTVVQLAASLSLEELVSIVRAGLPAPELPQGMTLERNLDGELQAIVWTPGSYSLTEGSQTRTLSQEKLPPAAVLDGAWQLEFPQDSGTPRSIEMPALIPLNLHEDFNVRHFSGTLIYRKPFRVDRDSLRENNLVFLDLGRVEIAARVRVNGQPIGSLWKPPYRLQITDYLHWSENQLEVEVTNLWPNRLIGDEHLPPENEYDPHGPILRLPDWYKEGKAKPGQRVTFACWHHYGEKDPLLQSGLSGPVTLLSASRLKVGG
jgi:hypothetical protein